MKTKVISVTPELARAWLKENLQNRNVRQSHVDFLAGEMKNGRWVVTHQGVCISDDGVLLDGQHRLLAVVESGLTVDMMVTTDADKCMMPVTDIGIVPRSVGDTLHMLDGVKESNIKVSACRYIMSICGHFQQYKLSVGIVRFVLDEFSDEIDFAVNETREFKPARVGWVIGTLAFCLHADKDCEDFIKKFGTGENLTHRDASKSLRDWFVNSSSANLRKSFKKSAIESVCNAAFNSINGKPITMIKSGSQGLDYFAGESRAFVEKMRAQLSYQINARNRADRKK